MKAGASHFAYLDARVALLSQQLLHRPERTTLLTGNIRAVDGLLKKAGVWHPKIASETPEQLEQRLTRQLLDESLVLLRGMSASGRHFIEYWLRRFEIINLKFILRAKFSALPRDAILPLLLDLGSLGSLPLQELVNTESVAEFLRHLQSTDYGVLAYQARKTFEAQRSLFDVEATLDAHYFHQLMYLATLWEGEQGRQCRLLLRTYLDQFNLIALLRFRLTYALSPPHTYFLLAPAGRYLPSELLQQLAQQSSLRHVMDALPQPLHDALAHADSIEDAENIMRQRTRHQASQILRHQHFSMARAFAYLYLREQQLRLLHTVLKGRMLNFDPELISRCGEPLTPPSPPTEAH